MKTLVLSLVGLFFLSLTTILGLFLTGHLIVVPVRQTVNYTDDNDKVLFSAVGDVIYYKVVFAK